MLKEAILGKEIFMENPMETKIAVIGIIIESKESVNMVNQILHQYSSCIIGRMGLPYEKKKISIISVVVDAPVDVISALSGKLGGLPGIRAKALHSRTPQN